MKNSVLIIVVLSVIVVIATILFLSVPKETISGEQLICGDGVCSVNEECLEDCTSERQILVKQSGDKPKWAHPQGGMSSFWPRYDGLTLYSDGAVGMLSEQFGDYSVKLGNASLEEVKSTVREFFEVFCSSYNCLSICPQSFSEGYNFTTFISLEGNELTISDTSSIQCWEEAHKIENAILSGILSRWKDCTKTEDCKLAYGCCGGVMGCFGPESAIPEQQCLCTASIQPYDHSFLDLGKYCSCEAGQCELKEDREKACTAACEYYMENDCNTSKMGFVLYEEFWNSSCANYSCGCFEEEPKDCTMPSCEVKKACEYINDCGYVDYADGCYNLENMAKCNREILDCGIIPRPATPRENVVCTCRNNECVEDYGCVDGDTYICYYPNPDGSLTFPLDHLPPQELIDIRVAYFEEHACWEGPHGYFVKENGGFKNVSEDEFNIFISDYNESCNGCLSSHFAGCC